jgi:hypothetical protein
MGVVRDQKNAGQVVGVMDTFRRVRSINIISFLGTI